MTRITDINELHNLSVKDVHRMPTAATLCDWSDKGLYDIDAASARFVVRNPNAPRIKKGPHAGRVDLNALRG